MSMGALGGQKSIPDPPGTRVKSNCEPPDVGAVNQILKVKQMLLSLSNLSSPLACF